MLPLLFHDQYIIPNEHKTFRRIQGIFIRPVLGSQAEHAGAAVHPAWGNEVWF